MEAVQNTQVGMQELSVDDVDQVSGGIIIFIALWAAAHNGGAYSEDRGAGAWG